MTQCITSYQAKYFAHSLTRRLPANDGAKFTATLPLHYTQKETEPGVFTLEMCVTKDFEIYMRRYENTTWEVEGEV